MQLKRKHESKGYVAELSRRKGVLISDLLQQATWTFVPPDMSEATDSKSIDKMRGKQELYARYLERKSQIKSGDIIAFNTYPGHSLIKNFFRRLSKAATGTKYTHVGIVVVVTITRPDGHSVAMPYIMEATTNPALTVDAIDGHGDRRNGVWCFALPTRIASDPAELWHIPLKDPISKEQQEQLEMWVCTQYKRDPVFDKDSMFGAGFDLFDDCGAENTFDDYNLLFCSEFVSSCYKKMGLLSQNVNCSEMTPADTCSLPFLDQTNIFQLKKENEYHESLEEIPPERLQEELAARAAAQKEQVNRLMSRMASSRSPMANQAGKGNTELEAASDGERALRRAAENSADQVSDSALAAKRAVGNSI